MKLRKLILITSIFLAFVLTSCSERIIGYSLVLWDITEENIRSGDVLPVYIKSNISQVYIVSNEAGEKIEVPLWKMTEPVKKREIEAIELKYRDCSRMYAHVKIDGLPCRAEPVNTSKQVYRFRKNEIIKILYKGEGQLPMSGGKPLEGEWYRVLTNDGTEGWCFSYNLNIFELDENGEPISDKVFTIEDNVDHQYNNIAENIWYPESFQKMIENKSFDLSLFNAAYKFVLDLENNKVILNTEDIHESWAFKGYRQVSDKEYVLNDIPIKIICKKDNFIVIRYTDSSGKPIDLPFVTLEEDVNELVKEEKQRRGDEYRKILSIGQNFTSSSYGKLSFTKDGTFKWTGFDLLVPSIIPSKEKNAGTVSVKYSISKSLAKKYDGVLSFKFHDMQDEINFLYKLEDSGLRLEDTATAIINGNQVTERGSSPVIMYFKSNK